jgi:predicted ATPase/class 3 adenylate cyclase
MTSLASQTQKLTLLYGDWSDYTRQAASPDQTSSFLAALDASLERLPQSEGHLLCRGAQTFVALWGLNEAQEKDAENAVRFALQLRDSVQLLASGNLLPLRLAITTGPVRLWPPEAHTDPGLDQLSGEAVDLCCQMPSILQDGGVAIDQETFRQVEGIFNCRALARLPIRGQETPVEIYRVLLEKQPQFRIFQHGIEGITTRLTGREIEMQRIRDAYETATEDHDNHLITIVGEAGMGKTRLLLEVRRWRALLNDSTRLFQAQATPEMLQQPYGLLRRLFTLRFEIQESDPEATAFEKLLAGVESFMGPDHTLEAQQLAQLVGLPCPGCPQTEDTGSAALFEQQALRSLSALFRAIHAGMPVGVIAFTLEDMHWADDKSLDALLWLYKENAHTRLVFNVLARPALFERRPRWGLEQANSIRIDLHALPKREARKLVREVLQKAPDVPDLLRDWIVEHSGGNPLHIEELARSLIATRVIEKGAGDEPWRVDLSRLETARIPDTLAGLLRTQIDNLPLQQRTALRRAAVIGRDFWDVAIAALEPGDGLAMPASFALSGLAKRNLIYRQENSSFSGMQEYTFVSNLMREEAYQGIPEHLRQCYHRLTAQWLAGVGGDASSAMAARIGDHYERADEGRQAAPYLMQAAEEARRLNAFTQAYQFLQRAVKYAEEPPSAPNTPGRAALLYRMGEIMIWLGEAAQALPCLRESLDLARQTGNTWEMAEALGRLGWAAYYNGNLEQALPWLEEAMACARQVNNRPALLLALRQLGNIALAQGDYPRSRALYEESLAIARELDDARSASLALNNLGVISLLSSDFSQARHYLEETIALAEGRGDRMEVALALGNLGIAAHMLGEYDLARQHLQQTIDICHATGSQLLAVEALLWSGITEIVAGNLGLARQRLQESLSISLETEQLPLSLGGLVGFAMLEAQQGRPERAIELLALASDNRSLDNVARLLVAQPLLDRLHGDLSPQAFGQAWARGQALDLQTIIQAYRAEGG